MNQIVRGLFSDVENVGNILSRLELAGFSDKDISVISNDENNLESFKITENTKLPEGAAIGAASGGLLASVAGGFAAVGAFATGGIGILAAGPIAAGFAAGAAGAAAGGALGGVYGTVFPDNEKQYFQDCVQQGAVMLVAHCEKESQVEQANQIFNQFDPIRVG